MKIVTRKSVGGYIRTYIFGIHVRWCYHRIGIDRKESPFTSAKGYPWRVYKQLGFPVLKPNSQDKWTEVRTKTLAEAIMWYVIYQTGLSRIVCPITKRINRSVLRHKYLKLQKENSKRCKNQPKHVCV